MKVFMLIMSSRLHLLSSVLIVLMTFNMMMNNVVADDEFENIIQNLPELSDFDQYLSALEKVIDFCTEHNYYVDLNLQFGLFLINVNLKQVMQQKRLRIPLKTRSRLEKIFVKNDALANNFHFMVARNQNAPNIGQNLKLSSLFDNAMWPKPFDTFNVDLLNETHFYSPEQLIEIYGQWEEYDMNVVNYERPSPAESDACIAFLMRSPPVRFNRRHHPNCVAPLCCRQLVQEGSDFGYGLTHRLLFLIIARFSRRCVVFSERKDRWMTDMYCKKCFNEGEYIVSNNLQLPDLLSEQIAACGLLGHAQFLQKSWLKSLLQFQTSEGCFSEKIATEDFDENQMLEDKKDEWKIERDSDIMNGQCNGHFTSVAAVTLSHALRLILENYY